MANILVMSNLSFIVSDSFKRNCDAGKCINHLWSIHVAIIKFRVVFILQVTKNFKGTKHVLL